MGQTENEYMSFDDTDEGRIRRLNEALDRANKDYLWGSEPYDEYGFCEMCGQDYGAILRPDGCYRCSHCEIVWNG